MSNLVIALDPGKISGVVTYRHDDGQLLDASEHPFFDVCRYVEMTAEGPSTTLTVVCESFIITAQTHKNTQAPWSLEVIGAVRYILDKHGQRGLIMQHPSAAKRFATDVKLKQLDWHQRGKTHANDAIRHLLLHLISTGWWDDRLTPA